MSEALAVPLVAIVAVGECSRSEDTPDVPTVLSTGARMGAAAASGADKALARGPVIFELVDVLSMCCRAIIKVMRACMGDGVACVGGRGLLVLSMRGLLYSRCLSASTSFLSAALLECN